MSIFSIPKYYLSGKYELLMNDMQNKMKQLMIWFCMLTQAISVSSLWSYENKGGPLLWKFRIPYYEKVKQEEKSKSKKRRWMPWLVVVVLSWKTEMKPCCLKHCMILLVLLIEMWVNVRWFKLWTYKFHRRGFEVTMIS